MKRYTMQGAIHDARVFYQLWLEHRRAKQKAAQAFSFRLAVPILGWYGPTRAGLRTHCLLKAIN